MKVAPNTLKSGDVFRGFPAVEEQVLIRRRHTNYLLMSPYVPHERHLFSVMPYGWYGRNLPEADLLFNIKSVAPKLRKMLCSKDVDTIKFALAIIAVDKKFKI